MDELFINYKLLCEISENYINTTNQIWICLFCENEWNIRVFENPSVDVYMCKSCIIKEYMKVVSQKYKLKYMEMVYKMISEECFKEMMMGYFKNNKK